MSVPKSCRAVPVIVYIVLGLSECDGAQTVSALAEELKDCLKLPSCLAYAMTEVGDPRSLLFAGRKPTVVFVFEGIEGGERGS